MESWTWCLVASCIQHWRCMESWTWCLEACRGGTLVTQRRGITTSRWQLLRLSILGFENMNILMALGTGLTCWRWMMWQHVGWWCVTVKWFSHVVLLMKHTKKDIARPGSPAFQHAPPLSLVGGLCYQQSAIIVFTWCLKACCGGILAIGQHGTTAPWWQLMKLHAFSDENIDILEVLASRAHRLYFATSTPQS